MEVMCFFHLSPKILHNLCFFHFSRVLQPSREKLKTMLKQNLGGEGRQIRYIMGNVEAAYDSLLKLSIDMWISILICLK